MLHEATTGSLRSIDPLATAALHEAAAHKRDRIERDIVRRILALDAEHRDF